MIGRLRGIVALRQPGELLIDVLPLACALGNALDLNHCIALCGATWRRGDLGATNDMMVISLRRQAQWLPCGQKNRQTPAHYRHNSGQSA